MHAVEYQVKFEVRKEGLQFIEH